MEKIIVKTLVNIPLEKAWQYWTEPAHVMKWNNATSDWHTPKAENDLRTGGSFTYTMAAKDGSFQFDFGGIYSDVKELAFIAYSMADGRECTIAFEKSPEGIEITETFDPEKMNPIDLQRNGWQAILDNFKKYAEAN